MMAAWAFYQSNRYSQSVAALDRFVELLVITLYMSLPLLVVFTAMFSIAPATPATPTTPDLLHLNKH